jgi:hypothetical protein
MNAHQMERAAYIAAHRILTTDLTAPELACPGARRSAMLDNMARIIKSVYEAHSQRFDEVTDWWPAEVPGIPGEIREVRRPPAVRKSCASGHSIMIAR